MSVFRDTMRAVKTYYTTPEREIPMPPTPNNLPTFQGYVDRFAELIVIIGDERAAHMVLSIEQDPITCVSLISDLMCGKVDETANKLYSLLAIAETSYSSVKLALDYLIKTYRDKNLPEDIPDGMLQAPENLNEEDFEF